MREPSKSIWYQLGYALESARHEARSAREVRSAKKAPPARKGRSAAEARSAGDALGEATDPQPRPTSSTIDQLIATGTGMLGDRLFSIVVGRRPGTLRLTRAALAGAGAALALSLFRNGKNGTPGVGESPARPNCGTPHGSGAGHALWCSSRTPAPGLTTPSGGHIRSHGVRDIPIRRARRHPRCFQPSSDHADCGSALGPE